MKKSVLWTLLIANGMSYICYSSLAYMHYAYYNAMFEALSITNLQLGFIGTVVGLTAIGSYFVGGAIADTISPRKMLILAAIFQIILLLIFATFPGYTMVLVLMTLGSFSLNALFWNGVLKFFRTQGKSDADEAKMYGYYSAMQGIGGAIFGLIGSYFIGQMGSSDGLALTLRVLAGYLVVTIILNVVLFKEAPAPTTSETTNEEEKDEKFKMAYLGIILKDPAFWLVCVAGYCLYTLLLALSYFAPLLHANYGVSLGIVSAIAVIRHYALRVFMAPIGGHIISKVGSLKLILIMLVIALVVSLLIAILPMNPDMLVFAIIALIVLAVAYTMSVPAQFSPVADIHIPPKMRSTAVGILCAAMYSGETYLYLAGGAILDTYDPITAYKIIYWGVSGIFFVGIVATIVLMRMMKVRNAKMQMAN